MKLTESILLAAYVGITNGCSAISRIGKTEIRWDYYRADGKSNFTAREGAAYIMRADEAEPERIELDADLNAEELENAEEFKERIQEAEDD